MSPDLVLHQWLTGELGAHAPWNVRAYVGFVPLLAAMLALSLAGGRPSCPPFGQINRQIVPLPPPEHWENGCQTRPILGSHPHRFVVSVENYDRVRNSVEDGTIDLDDFENLQKVVNWQLRTQWLFRGTEASDFTWDRLELRCGGTLEGTQLCLLAWWVTHGRCG